MHGGDNCSEREERVNVTRMNGCSPTSEVLLADSQRHCEWAAVGEVQTEQPPQRSNAVVLLLFDECARGGVASVQPCSNVE